jgi:hypothetical protein
VKISTATIVAALSALALAACAGPNESTADGTVIPTAATKATTTPKPVSTLRDSASVGVQGELGVAEPLGALTIKVASIAKHQIDNQAGAAIIRVDARIENPTAVDNYVPNFAIRCEGNATIGPWSVGTTLQTGTIVPAGTFSHGTVDLGLPEGTTARTCEHPVVRVGGVLGGDAVLYPVPAKALA